MMNCRRCLKPADCELHHFGPLCKNCFSQLIEKRVRKHIRIHELFKKWDTVMERDFIKPEIKWFIGGKLNVSYNCLDRHLKTFRE